MVQWDPSKSVIDSGMVAICGPCEIRMVEAHTRTLHGKRVLCWSGFPLQGVHQFELPQLSDMSNRLSRGSLHIINYWINVY
jgi:hypothetical protein